MKVLAKTIFGEKLIFGEPNRKPTGWYTKMARDYIKQFLKAIENGTCTTNMAKVPTVPDITREEKIRMYNAIKSLYRRKRTPVNVSIIEDDLWLVYMGDKNG